MICLGPDLLDVAGMGCWMPLRTLVGCPEQLSIFLCVDDATEQNGGRMVAECGRIVAECGREFGQLLQYSVMDSQVASCFAHLIG